jgi:hypothetical protein
MSTKAITPRLADRFCLLAVSQLQTQAACSAALDGGALGVVRVVVAAAEYVRTVVRMDAEAKILAALRRAQG